MSLPHEEIEEHEAALGVMAGSLVGIAKQCTLQGLQFMEEQQRQLQQHAGTQHQRQHSIIARDHAGNLRGVQSAALEGNEMKMSHLSRFEASGGQPTRGEFLADMPANFAVRILGLDLQEKVYKVDAIPCSSTTFKNLIHVLRFYFTRKNHSTSVLL